MPIASADIQYRLSGGAGNADANAALGGAKSSTAAPSALFDDVPSAESVPGDVEYRCIYVHNNHGTLTLQNAVLWIQANTPSGDTAIDVSLGTSAINGTEQTVANENTAPTGGGISFVPAATQGAGIALGNIPAGQHKAVWIRRTVNAAAAAANDTYNLRTAGDTAA
jgi:hypothetical protein